MHFGYIKHPDIHPVVGYIKHPNIHPVVGYIEPMKTLIYVHLYTSLDYYLAPLGFFEKQN